MKIGTLNANAKNIRINSIDRTASNTAVDGSVHGYYWGSHKQITFNIDWLSADDRQTLEAARTGKIELVLDTGEKYNVRLSLGEFNEVWIDNEPVYSVEVTATEVVT